jgi:hypothetical protein
MRIKELMPMKKTALLFSLVVCFYFISAAQENKKPRYFNINNKEISEKKFKEWRATNSVLDVVGDSSHHYKLIKRAEKGTIKDFVKLRALLEKTSGTKIDSLKTLVIIYYPGQDPCNSSVSASLLKASYTQMKSEVNAITKTEVLYIYKDFAGLEKFNNSVKWIKDPENSIEHLFFKYHYPCESFVAISKNGDYISYFGEFPKSFVVEAVRKLK